MVENTVPIGSTSPTTGCCAWRKRRKNKQPAFQKVLSGSGAVANGTNSSNCCFGGDKKAESEEEDEFLVNELWNKPLIGRRTRADSEKASRQEYARNSFRYYGIALQSPQDYYNFLQRPTKPYENPDNYPPTTTLPPKLVVFTARQAGKHGNDVLTASRHDCENSSERDRTLERKSSRDRCSATKPTGKEISLHPNNFSLCSQTASCSTSPYRKATIPLYGVVNVKLQRRNGAQLGLGIAGGSDRQIPPTISYLRPGFIAHRSDRLQVGERLLSVNGFELAELTHHQIMVLLRNAGPCVELAVEYDLNASCFRRPPAATTLQRCVEIGLEDEFDEGCDGSSPSSLRKGITIQQDSQNTSLYGLTLRGGAYGPDQRKNRQITIVAIRPGGPAHREGRLRVGDRILAINNVDVCNTTLIVAQNLLSRGLDTTEIPEKQGRVVQLTVEYDVPVLSTLQKANGPILLEIEKVPGIDFGLVLSMRRNKSNGTNAQKSRSIIVQGIGRASVADRCGAIHVGDQLLAIDGITLEFTNLGEVYQLLRSQCLLLRLEILPQVQRINCEELDSRQVKINRAAEQLLYSKHSTIVALPNGATSPDGVRRRRSRESQITGLKRHVSPCGRQTIRSIRQPSPTHQRLNSNTSSSCSPPEVQTRQPARTQAARKAVHRNHTSTMGNNSSDTVVKSSSSPIPSRNSRRPNLMSKSMTNNPSWPLERFPLLSGPGSVTGRFVQNAVGSSIPSGQICHAETMEVALHDDSPSHSLTTGGKPSSKTFGISLERVLDEDGFEGHLDEAASSNSSTNALFISNIERNSAADKCGVLQVGDRIISINDWFTANGSMEEAIHVLSHCGNSVNLLVEFDVIESVLPSSGQFLVKLAKRGNNLGIVCKSETNCEKGEPVIISHIRTGSVAHRSGSIQAGDRIKAIDNIALDSCTVEESMRLLQRSGNVVKLCVVKGQDQQDSEAQASNNSIVYSIELSRKSQPLGITIASSSGNTSPVVISSIAPGGLAERTGAMHVGDRIIAINGELLEGKKVAQAINLLQQSTDVVSIKLCRTLGTTEMPTGGWRCSLNNHTLSIIQSDSVSSDGSNKLETPIKSVDSAVESLEDSAEGVGANLAKLGLVGRTKSSIGFHHTRPSTSHHYYIPQQNQNQDIISGGSSEQAWDSGLSSAADTTTTINGHVNECCACSSTANTPTTTSGGKSIQVSSHNSPSESGTRKHEEDWMRILEALETVGEEEMLKKLEDSIMSYGRVGCVSGGNGTLTQTRRPTSPPRSIQFPPLSTSNLQNNNALLSRKSQQQPPTLFSKPELPTHQISSALSR